MVRRPRPVLRICDQAMLDRVEMDVVEVSTRIALVPDLVLPEASLPDSGFLAAPVRWIAEGLGAAGAEVLAREDRLDARPPSREICIIRRESLYAVNVIG